MATIGNYDYEITDGATRTLEGNEVVLRCITITNTQTNQSVRINDITNVFENEEWLEIAHTEAVNTLEGTPNCCLTGQVEWNA
jgi:hypothetical protein